MPDRAEKPSSPTELDVLIETGGRLEKAGDMAGVRGAALRYLARHPHEAVALVLLGRAELLLERPACALAPLQRSARVTNQFVFHLLHADCLKKLGLHDQQRVALENAARRMPHAGSAYFMAGVAFEGIRETDRAVRFYRQALELLPDEAGLHHRLGRILIEKGETADALHHITEALRHKPDDPIYLVDHSVALEHMGRLDEALVAAEKALLQTPDNQEAIHNRGHLLFNLNRSTEALDVFDGAIENGLASPKTHFSRGVTLLKLGRLSEGWEGYETRWGMSQKLPTNLPAPLWQGESLAGRDILLHAEQGFGDSLQFIRFASRLAAQGATVTALVPPALTRLFARVDGVTHSVSDLTESAYFDFHCPLASLPHRLAITTETIPSAPYFSVPREEALQQGGAIRRLMWSSKGSARRVVGLVWSGAPRPTHVEAHAIDKRRSMPLTALASLVEVPDTVFVSFQMHGGRLIRESALPIIDGTEGITDFADTAARLLGIDLLVSVDTSIVHLAGGLGLPVWMLSRFDGCWRWLEDRTDTAWYPTMRIFRQPQLNDWASVVNQVKTELMSHCPVSQPVG
ncbi:tetratricopeptide repeat protein [Acetobacter conturbans]|uniref:Tetratricopeptide repeat protein n=1 Tax=Acetobacter conturbans TaxID=1737472 RepID=A0ABX0JZJ3_9PROT|nr:tetratricopeptide repeat-containing glycosyltransferase family protein [Acetobacter conturbans]NHN88766.1 tetratricopeptide repeat protein [Acetobacter conturbans]